MDYRTETNKNWDTDVCSWSICGRNMVIMKSDTINSNYSTLI